MRWTNRTQSSLSESFFTVFIGKYFLFHHCPLWDSKYHFPNFRRTVLVNGLMRGNLWLELTEHKAVSHKASFQFLSWDVSFFTIALYVPPNITLQFHKNSLSERLPEGKAVARWYVLTEHTAFSQNGSFQFLTEDISFFTLALYGLPNITLQISQNSLS